MLRLAVENIVRFNIITMVRKSKESLLIKGNNGEGNNGEEPRSQEPRTKTRAFNKCEMKECAESKNGHHDFRSGRCVLCGCVISINGGRRTRNKHNRRRSSTRRR
jgi:hypothetical protein